MLKVLFLGLLAVSSWSMAAEAPDDHNRYITSKIAKYTQAFKRCQEVVNSRPGPGIRVVDTLKGFPLREVERLLMSKAVLLRHECEKPELTELAYAIVITEGKGLQPRTQKAISAIKTLAFSGDYRTFRKIYQSVPKEIRQDVEGIDYFDRPFDDRLVLEAVRGEQDAN
ncbi:hypothetical protein CF392_07325 [Tamilnaduibacter salinus]|uniref:Uncharacterized protein n=1 Tax=Tamilnaduibacter salinus TaxID=1484056 RepID=A0A2A2I2D4_9GAMM|nr:hypothetical protein [Tamilnaduibacter salinus]PAV26181.1 hypothetical protein CF392_07325 [Tamilnaduibacter salinus]